MPIAAQGSSTLRSKPRSRGRERSRAPRHLGSALRGQRPMPHLGLKLRKPPSVERRRPARGGEGPLGTAKARSAQRSAGLKRSVLGGVTIGSAASHTFTIVKQRRLFAVIQQSFQSATIRRVAKLTITDSRAAILRRVRAIPPGYVRTYGDVSPGAPRLAGYVLSRVEADAVPWHRVVRADGSLAKGARQRRLLEAEDVPFDGQRVALSRARLDDLDAG